MALNLQKAVGSKGLASDIPDDAQTSEQPTVNRKKQKRREKQAAKLASTHTQAELAPKSSTPVANGTFHSKSAVQDGKLPNGHSNSNRAGHAREEEELFFSDEEPEYDQGFPSQTASKSKGKKKKSRNDTAASQYAAFHVPGAFQPPPPPPPPPVSNNTVAKQSRNSHKHSIWNTSTAEERERIKEFWIGLDEIERRSLVKVEKEAVLKKMKEQQKHSCSCSVCGRKRNAIEEELEVLYDAYYEELEQYANHRQLGIDGGHPMLPPPGSYPPVNKNSLRRDSRIMHRPHLQSHRMAGTYEDDELDDEEFSDDEDNEEDDEDYDEDSYTSEAGHHPVASDIFTLGKNLTAQGGILTVADDLLKNDGRKFIEMMEQLAERRMQREEEAQYAARGLAHPLSSGHNHPPLDDDEYDDEDDDDYASDDDDDYDEDEMDSMSEEQRMEEGRRMFQIFAARMFEQRVLTAYREKVARERQDKLLEEIADESRLDEQREAKKARDALKKKEKKNKQKAAKEEEKLKREAEKAEQEAAEKAAEEKRLEEQRARKEAQRKKREAEKQAQEAERQRKEAEKLRKQQEARDQQLEQERRQRENKEKERRRKDEAKMKEKEEREAREKERREREAAAKSESDLREAQEREAREKSRKDESARPVGHPAPVPIPLARKASSTVPIPPGISSVATSSPSPHLQIATPSIPKAPAPVKPRQTSRQGSIQSSPKSTTQPASSSATSPSSTNVPQPLNLSQPITKQSQPPVTLPQPMHHNSAPIAPPPGMHPLPHNMMSGPPGFNSPAFNSGFAPVPPPGIMHRTPMGHDLGSFPQQQPFNSPMYRGYNNTPNAIGFPPGISPAPRQPVPGRGSPGDVSASQIPIGTGVVSGQSQTGSHSRNTSASFESPGQIQPIGRPSVVAAPRASINTGRPDISKQDVDGISKQLGSSALLDDADDALDVAMDRPHIGSTGNRPARLGFGGNQMFPDAISSSKTDVFPRSSGWGAPPIGFGTPTMSSTPHWSSTPNNHWLNNAFGSVGGPARQSRPVILRLLVCQACKSLSNHLPEGSPPGFGYHAVEAIIHQLEQTRSLTDTGFTMQEILDICETEGNPQNGGGSLSITNERGRGVCVKWIPDGSGSFRPHGMAPGEIGSPLIGSAFGSSRPFSGLPNSGF